jgi:hypothetical protein
MLASHASGGKATSARIVQKLAAVPIGAAANGYVSETKKERKA